MKEDLKNVYQNILIWRKFINKNNNNKTRLYDFTIISIYRQRKDEKFYLNLKKKKNSY